VSIFPVGTAVDVGAKTPGTVHCYGGICHRINSVEEMSSIVGRRRALKASYYDDCRRDRFNPCGLTSSGAIFRPDLADNAASPIFPDGTVLLAYNPKSKQAAVVRVTSAGPYRGDRTLDVSRATAARLGFLKQGVAQLEIAVLQAPTALEARYKRLRKYPEVPGFIGSYATFDAAQAAAVGRMMGDRGHVPHLTAQMPPANLTIEQAWPRGLAMDVAARVAHDASVADMNEHAKYTGHADVGPLAAVTARDVDIATSTSPPQDAQLSVASAGERAGQTIGAEIYQRVLVLIEIARRKAKLNREIEVGANAPGMGRAGA
jgi:Lytic transglycolase